MLLKKERQNIVYYGNQLVDCGLTTGSGGNVSIFNRAEGLIAFTPSSMKYADIRPEDVVVLDAEGKLVEGERRVSTELNMHLTVYRNRPEVCGVVHTHSVYATAVACMGWDLQPVHYMLAMAGPVVRCSRYATYGTQELADLALEALGGNRACLLGNHGLLAVGDSVESAFSTAEHLEFVAKLSCITKSLGEPQILSECQIREVMDKFGTAPYK